MRPAGAAVLIALALALVLAASPLLAQGRPRAGARPAAAPTPVQLLGRWGDHGDCGKHVIFRGDGTFRSYTGGEGSWRLVGQRLTMTGANGSFVLIVRLIDRSHLRIVNPDGTVGVSQRC